MKVTKAATIQESRVFEPNARDGLCESRLQRLTAIAVIPLCQRKNFGSFGIMLSSENV
jgi:hypothetical protein